MLAMYTLGIVVAIVVGVCPETNGAQGPAAAVPDGIAAVSSAESSHGFSEYGHAGVAVSEACRNGDPGDLDNSLGVDVFSENVRSRTVGYASVSERVAIRERLATNVEPLPESEQLKNSYAGKLGHAIEPVISPLGFDWKIGVALIASFAAREVLVSTLSIIYNVGKDENEESETLIAAVREAKTDDGRPAWTPLTALTLMVFFVLAMQCMSTLAIVRRETNSWSWPLFMVAYMTVLAYIAAFITYQGGKLLGFA